MTPHLVPAEDPVLKTIATEVNPNEFEELSELLEKGLKTFTTGIGLALPQLGVGKQGFILLGLVFKQERNRICFNPKILRVHPEKQTMGEGCLSLPNVEVLVERSIAIEAQYTTPTGETVTEILTGLPARVFQHEFDHLQGILITDRNPIITPS